MKTKKLSLETLESRLAPATFIVGNLNDSGPGSLRQALADADQNPGTDIVVFRVPPPAPHEANVIRLTSGQLTSKGAVTIRGPGADKLILDGNFTTRILSINDGTAADSPVTISGLSIMRGSASSGTGGGISSRESLILSNMVLAGNAGVFGGGGVDVVGADGASTRVSVIDSLITGNFAEGSGAGMRLIGLSAMTIRNCVVSGNSADGSGGGIFANLHSTATGATVTGSVFSGNSASAGGGLYIYNENFAPKSLMAISGCQVSGNVAETEGGGLYLAGGSAAILSSHVLNNTATMSGGGVYATGVVALSVSSCVVAGNRTIEGIGRGGGGIFVLGSGLATPQPVRIAGTRIADNRSARDGGGLAATGGLALSMTGVTVSGNTARSGGGVRTFGSDVNEVNLTVRGGSFSDNVSEDFGGGLRANGSGAVSITGSRVERNNARLVGGGLSIENSSDLVVLTNLVVVGNAAQNGGGIYVSATPNFRVVGGSFRSNSAFLSNGGGILTSNSSGVIRGVSVTGNSAEIQGGGVSVVGGLVSLQLAKVKGNYAPIDANASGPFKVL